MPKAPENKITIDQMKWTALRQKNQKSDYDYANIPATRRDLRDMERRLLQKLTYRIGGLILVALSALAIFLK